MTEPNTLTVIEPGTGSRFVAWLNDMARVAEAFARVARNPEVQATGAAFFDTLTSSANNELGPVKASLSLTVTTDTQEEPDHAG